MATKVKTSFPISYHCGHSQKVDLKKRFPKKPLHKINQGFADWLSERNTEDERVCDNCFKESKTVDHNQWMLDIQAFEEKYILPEFTGTDKQLNSDGLVEGAKKDRYAVLSELFEDPTEEAKEQHSALLDAARTVAYIGFWRNTLGYKERTEAGYGQSEYIALLLSAAEEEHDRQQNTENSDYIDTENPHDWDGHDG